MKCAFESRAPLQGGADMTRAIPEKQPAGPECGGWADLAFAARPAVAPYQISIEQLLPIQRCMLGVFSCYDLGGSLFMVSGSATSLTSTAVTLTPHGSVCRSMISCNFWLIDSRCESRSSKGA